MKKKVISVLLGMAMMSSVVTGCGSNPVSAPASGSSTSQGTGVVSGKEETVASSSEAGVLQNFPFTLEDAPERNPEERREESVAVSVAYHDSRSSGDLARIKFFYPEYAGSETDITPAYIYYTDSDSDYDIKSCVFGASADGKDAYLFEAKYLPEVGELYVGTDTSGAWEGCYIAEVDQMPKVYCEKATVKDKDITDNFDIAYTRFRVNYGDDKNELFMIVDGVHNSQSLYSLGTGSLDELLQMNPTYDVDNEVSCEFTDV